MSRGLRCIVDRSFNNTETKKRKHKNKNTKIGVRFWLKERSGKCLQYGPAKIKNITPKSKNQITHAQEFPSNLYHQRTRRRKSKQFKHYEF
jgi:hypothetical protein